MTSRIRDQAPKHYPKWRRLMMNFFLLCRGISSGSDALWKLKQRSVTQLSVECGLFIGEYKKYTVSGVIFSFNCFRALDSPPFLHFEPLIVSHRSATAIDGNWSHVPFYSRASCLVTLIDSSVLSKYLTIIVVDRESTNQTARKS